VRNRLVTVLFASALSLAIVLVWGLGYDFDSGALAHYFPTLFLAANLFACVFVFGREHRQSETSAAAATIDALEDADVRAPRVADLLATCSRRAAPAPARAAS
jgi:hypothetical protein